VPHPMLTERGRRTIDGITAADSIAIDPHKGLSVPFGVGALLVRDEEALIDANQGRGAYLRAEDNYQGIRDIAALGPELSRPFRALQVWLPLSWSMKRWSCHSSTRAPGWRRCRLTT